ncbi:MAG: GtrA family protein [Rhodobiaceae bacterium]|nr:GtrA family protein [Rhodobiaceae bacterium]
MTRLKIPPVLRFATVGLANSTIDFSVFSALHLALGLAIVPANILSYAVAASFSYLANSRWTFAGRKKERDIWDFVRFQLVNLIGLALATTVLVVLAAYIPVLVAKLCAIGASFAWSFSILNLVVWPKRTPR